MTYTGASHWGRSKNISFTFQNMWSTFIWDAWYMLNALSCFFHFLINIDEFTIFTIILLEMHLWQDFKIYNDSEM